MGKLIVLEGTDGCGKSTQFDLLTQRLRERGTDFRQLRFPQYGKPSASLIEMYLGGEFGKRPGDVNAYMASMFYAADRCASYLQDWRAYYERGGLLLSDRYTTSNAVHQGGKLPPGEQEAFFEWLHDFEYNRLGLPRPDLVILLDLPIELSQALITNRGEKKDIHEKDPDYLRTCRTAARQAAAYYGWTVVDVSRKEKIRTIEDISAEIDAVIKPYLEVSL